MNFRRIAALAVLAALLTAGPARGASDHHLADDAGVLSARDHASVERQLKSAGRRLGSPLFVELTARLHGESVTEKGERRFAGRALGDDPSINPVLLLVAVKDRHAAIATGKGNAGIVPEMDAARITKELLASQASRGWRVALNSAIDAIVESAEATAERRRPLPAEAGEPPPVNEQAPTPRTVPAPVQETDTRQDDDRPPGADAAPDAGALPPGFRRADSPARGRSRLPLAVGAGVLLLLALALRRRKQFAAARANQGQNPLPPHPRNPSSLSGPDPRLGRRPPRSPRR